MFDGETVGERGQMLTISTRISGRRKEKAAKYGPLSRRCSRIILRPTGSWAIAGGGRRHAGGQGPKLAVAATSIELLMTEVPSLRGALISVTVDVAGSPGHAAFFALTEPSTLLTYHNISISCVR